MRVAAVLIVGLIGMAGCKSSAERQAMKLAPPTYSQYHLDGFAWDQVSRVLVLPIQNESPYTNADEEMQTALTGELQRLGRFEVIAAQADDRAIFSKQMHRLGRFDEGDMLDIARKTRADIIVHGTLSQYSPYPRPRMGLILQAVVPKEGKVAASVDGVWDTTDTRVSDRVRAYYRQKPHEKSNFVRTHVIASDGSFAGELALDSPALFQRFVAREAGLILLDLPVPGVTVKLKKPKGPE